MFSWRGAMGRKQHVSIFIGIIAAGIIVGVALAELAGGMFGGVAWLATGILLVATVFVFQKTWMVCLALVGGLVLGLWRGGIEKQNLQNYQSYVSKTVQLKGKLFEDTTAGKGGAKNIVLSEVSIDNRTLSSQVWLTTRTNQELQRSDMVVFEGTLKPGFGSFAASMSFAKLKDHTPGADDARDFRDWFSDHVRRVINEPEASLGIGFLVGQRSSLPDELDEQLRVVGLTHIVVASGYNLTILVRLSRRLFVNISKYLTAATSFSLIWGFMLVTGFSPSMSRAGLVAGLLLLAWYYGRKISPFILLPFVAAITLLINPSYIWGDVGWMLSFAAFGGVMILAPLMQDYFFGPNKPGFIRQVLGETVAALLLTAPIIMLVFGQYSAYALPSNLLVVPLIPFIMLATFLAGLTSAFLPFLAQIIPLPASGLLIYVTSIVEKIASFPGALLDIQLNAIGVSLYYILLLACGVYLWRKTKHKFINDNLVD